MDCRTQRLKKLTQHISQLALAKSRPMSPTGAASGKVLELGRAFVKTVRISARLNSRSKPCPTRASNRWWIMRPLSLLVGLLLFCLKLGSRRQLDFALRDDPLWVLDNLNRLAQTEQESLPVNKTLSHFLGHVGSAALAQLRTDCVRQLIRNKVLDSTRLQGCLPSWWMAPDFSPSRKSIALIAGPRA